MKKLLIIAVCALLMVPLLAGCSGLMPEAEPETETTAPTEWIIEAVEEEAVYEDKVLTLLPLWQEDSPEAVVLTQAAEVFEIQTGCRVEILWNGSEEGIADLYQIPGEELAGYTGRLLDLTEMAAGAGYAEKSYQRLSDLVISRCGFLGAIPQSPYVTGFYYNTEAFETSGVIRPPETWEQFVSMCALLRAGGYQSLTFAGEDADDLLLTHLTQYLGAEEMQNLMASGGWEREEVLTAATDIFDFVLGGNLTTGTPAGTDRVATSNSAIAYGTNALCTRAENAALADLSWGMFPYPGVGGLEGGVKLSADVLAIDASCPEPQAAFDFIMLLTTGEFDQLRTDVTIGIPADPANDSPIEGAVEALEQARILETPEADLTEKQRGYILKLWRGKYEDVSEFLKDLQKHY